MLIRKCQSTALQAVESTAYIDLLSKVTDCETSVVAACMPKAPEIPLLSRKSAGTYHIKSVYIVPYSRTACSRLSVKTTRLQDHNSWGIGEQKLVAATSVKDFQRAVMWPSG